MRILVPLAAFVALVAVIVQELYAVHATWSVVLAVVVAGAGVVVVGIALRYGIKTSWPMVRRTLPRDPGFPRDPLGAPYRGPRC